MVEQRGKVAVAMSGGVDSSVAAALLVEQGHDVFGLMLRLWSEPGNITERRDNRCCTRDQMIDAHLVARQLGIPFEVIDARDTFKTQVVDQFVTGYSTGITPNPCLSCNRHIRFTFLLNEALERGATYLATGHYARITVAEDGTVQLRKGADLQKDQSYVLSVLTQDQLRHALFPVGEYAKPQVRELAAKFGLRVASKGESQDLCFIADGDYRRFMRSMAPEGVVPGPIRLRTGELVGTHTGLPNYTIGQRKGLGLAWPEPLYVLGKEPRTNTLLVGKRAELGAEYFHVTAVHWLDGITPTTDVRAEVKTRYTATPVRARVAPVDKDAANIWLDEPVADITPGQGAVFYQDDLVLGGGIIAAPD
jgi:tRNA-specific 2-thiouridylase